MLLLKIVIPYVGPFQMQGTTGCSIASKDIGMGLGYFEGYLSGVLAIAAGSSLHLEWSNLWDYNLSKMALLSRAGCCGFTSHMRQSIFSEKVSLSYVALLCVVGRFLNVYYLCIPMHIGSVPLHIELLKHILIGSPTSMNPGRQA